MQKCTTPAYALYAHVDKETAGTIMPKRIGSGCIVITCCATEAPSLRELSRRD